MQALHPPGAVLAEELPRVPVASARHERVAEAEENPILALPGRPGRPGRLTGSRPAHHHHL